ncbi:DUF4405 domain-containing protein [Azospirillum rugosum]|uniref:DUF4405 domain-containing protein n=1 Tax=Azospirillum rugosum TaxID=416170 RepID=UPI0031B88ADE
MISNGQQGAAMRFSSFSFSRHVVTPVTIVLFVVSTVTGIMLLLHWNAGLVRFSHEWLSVGFSAIALWHLARNWKAFLGYLKRDWALAAFAISLGASLVITGMTGSSGPSTSGPGAIIGAVSNAPLETAAPLFGLSADKAVQALKAANIEARPDETLTVIGNRAGTNAIAIAAVLNGQRRRAPQS